MASIFNDGTLIGQLQSDSTLSGKTQLPNIVIPEVDIATKTTPGVVIVGENLDITPSGVLSVSCATDCESDNTKPITSAAVYMELGNIDVILKNI